MNDIESTELFRQKLAGSGGQPETICPFVFLRRDRHGRTVSFAEYIDILYDCGLIDRVHVGGAFTGVFARNVAPSAVQHDTDHHSAAEILDRLVQQEHPILLVANTVHPWMRALQAEIEARRDPSPQLESLPVDPRGTFMWVRVPDAPAPSQEGLIWQRTR